MDPKIYYDNIIRRANNGLGDGTYWATATTAMPNQAYGSFALSGLSIMPDAGADANDKFVGYTLYFVSSGRKYTITDWLASTDTAYVYETPHTSDTGACRIIKTVYESSSDSDHPAKFLSDGKLHHAWKGLTHNQTQTIVAFMPNFLADAGFERQTPGTVISPWETTLAGADKWQATATAILGARSMNFILAGSSFSSLSSGSSGSSSETKSSASSDSSLDDSVSSGSSDSSESSVSSGSSFSITASSLSSLSSGSSASSLSSESDESKSSFSSESVESKSSLSSESSESSPWSESSYSFTKSSESETKSSESSGSSDSSISSISSVSSTSIISEASPSSESSESDTKSSESSGSSGSSLSGESSESSDSSGSIDTSADIPLTQDLTGTMHKDKTYRVMFKAKALGANPTGSIIRIRIRQIRSPYTTVDTDFDWYPTLTTAAAWFEKTLTADFTSDNLQIYIEALTASGSWGGCTGFTIDEFYVYRDIAADRLIALDHEWNTGAVTSLYGCRCDPARTTFAVGNDASAILISAETIDQTESVLETFTESNYPVWQLILTAKAEVAYDTAHLFLGPKMDVEYLEVSGFDPHREAVSGRSHIKATGARAYDHEHKRGRYEFGVKLVSDAIHDEWGLWWEEVGERRVPFCFCWDETTYPEDVRFVRNDDERLFSVQVYEAPYRIGKVRLSEEL